MSSAFAQASTQARNGGFSMADDNPVVQAAREAADKINEIVTDQKAMVSRCLERIGGLPYPREREAPAVMLIKSFAATADEFVWANNVIALREPIDQTCREADLLTQPISVPSFREHLAAVVLELQRATWTSEEIDLLVKYGAERPHHDLRRARRRAGERRLDNATANSRRP
jgi:hypothetical protein